MKYAVHHYSLVLVLFALSAAMPARAGVTFTCDPNIDATRAGTCAYLNGTIAGLYSAMFSNANAKIYIQYGATDLGQSTLGFDNQVSYTAFLTALTASANASGDAVAIAAVKALNSLDTKIYGSGNVDIPSALGTALGLTGMVGTSADGSTPCFTPGTGSCYNGIITVSSTPGTFYYRSGIEGADEYDFYATVEHEVDELLGTSSCIDTSGPPLANDCPGTKTPAAVDLFRYQSAGKLVLIGATPGAYFSYNGGQSNGANGKVYNTLSNGDDYADFVSTTPCQAAQSIQDAEGCPGEDHGLDITNDGGAEINILAAVGYALKSPPIESAAGFLDKFGAPALTFNGSTSFPDAGGLLIGPPGVAQAPDGDVFVVGLDSAGGVHLNSYSYANSTWKGWQYSGGILATTTGMTATVDPKGVVWFTGRDSGNRFWINSWNGTTFGGWILVANGIFASASTPQIAIPSDGTIYVIGKDIGGRIWSNSYNPTSKTFTGWVDRHGVMIGQPSAAAGQDGFVYVAVRSVSSNSPVYVTRIPANNAATANTWLNGGGQIDSDPYIASQYGLLYLTALAGGGTVYVLPFSESGQTYGAWNFTNGILSDETIAAAAGNVFIGGRDSGDRIYWYNVGANSWFFSGGAGDSSTVLTGAK